eukprot:CAMPEP_0202924460 /NCGR_PEP_ID=MMETSP1392-20130828/78991_1 /ASSEMBLY_ACC=CAM_ASM_000868 /TAXON_ID=225041 /ORGANISM="Chlamydomonas chlamydogama, Strain SAG 11-48b" /LENGTH=228 /DNA_ID=CAMNT_0049618201 /DNA_START=9 /DNA_END=695 /DNA_ORIENTATION=+
MQAVYLTLLEVALAIRHLHHLHLVHCDLKASNVLLKSNPRDPRGFASKVSDFGHISMMVEGGSGHYVVSSAELRGTPSHMAPEVIQGALQTEAIDVYAFGVLMWELVSSCPLYPGLKAADIQRRVVSEELRPEFDTFVDLEYRRLAEQCWSADPGARPTSAQLVEIIQAQMASQGLLPTPKMSPGLGPHKEGTAAAVGAAAAAAAAATGGTGAVPARYSDSDFPLHIL